MVSPIIDIDNNFSVNYPYLEFDDYRSLAAKLNKSITDILDDIIFILDITRFDYHGAINSPYCYTYVKYCENYYWYLLKVDNQLLYNHYVNKLIKTHKDNVEFYNTKDKEAKEERKANKNTKKHKVRNQYYRDIKRNLFTGEEEYEYYNPKTGDSFYSDNPNLLDELNAKPKRSKKDKDSGVPLSAMTFKF